MPSETAAMVDGLIARAEEAMLTFLNATATEIFEQSQLEVPKSGEHQARPNDPSYPEDPLEETGELIEATPETMEATIVYHAPYAAAQHEGRMVAHRASGKVVEWEAENYTTAGTKSHYLSDPAKAAMANGEEALAAQASGSLGFA